MNSNFLICLREAKEKVHLGYDSQGDIKLRIMSELTEKTATNQLAFTGRKGRAKAHEEEMLGHWKKACNIE